MNFLALSALPTGRNKRTRRAGRGTNPGRRRNRPRRGAARHSAARRGAAPCAERRKSCYIVPTRRGERAGVAEVSSLFIDLLNSAKEDRGPLGV